MSIARNHAGQCEANARDLGRQRTTYEDAIAVLVGENPSNFTIPRRHGTRWCPKFPAWCPARSCNAAPTSPRRAAVAAANGHRHPAAAFFPTITLTGTAGPAR
jgi:outer membrane protein TolC